MTWMIVAAVCAGVVLGAVLGWLAAGRVLRTGAAPELSSALAGARARIEVLEQERGRSEVLWRERVEQYELQRRESAALLESTRADAQRRLDEQRRDLEGRIAEQARVREQEQQDAAARRHREEEERGRVLEALAPVRDRLNAVQTAVTRMESERQSQYGALGEQLARAREADRQLRATTSALEAALRNTSVRGAWGEAQLRNIVESAGLVEHVDFDVQSSVSTEEGRRRPDMVLHLPGGKSLPIDAKVPFDSYIRAMEIPANAEGEEGRRRSELMAAHVKALRGHVDALAKRSYWEALDASPDFVIAFVPSESLLSAALEADPSLLDHAFQKRVALASPVTLWSVMRTVAYAWQQEVLTDQAKELFDLSRELYSRISRIAGYAEAMRSSLEKSVGAWNSFAGSLEKRVLVTARKLGTLDESTVIPTPRTIDQAPRLLTAPELVTAEAGDRGAVAAEGDPA
ncbi:DNA recombination protein RmuC [Actinomyces polynesiensis]|uniref:DNA recombination protein RmuC n=1 Tax=Actinomyces polynesiensis TaxID=1325934 RepID=UPI0006950E36|nr:DNA recombination protein RmuC [Actinomyces polynesiensis]